jgi:tRNA 2-thiouridine synthesizing protein A
LEERWDAGEMGCGQLVFELHVRMNQLKPGDRLEVIARDPGAPTDLPAWCRMTGHTLVSADHPVYVIQRKTG